MVNYECCKCNKKFTKKCNYKSHIKRKTSCMNLNNIESEKNNVLNPIESGLNPIESGLNPIESDLDSKLLNSNKKDNRNLNDVLERCVF
jgi:hypothetical protein